MKEIIIKTPESLVLTKHQIIAIEETLIGARKEYSKWNEGKIKKTALNMAGDLDDCILHVLNLLTQFKYHQQNNNKRDKLGGMCKGGQNPPNNSPYRPIPPQGSDGINNQKSV